jgi:hypothetical protein
METYIKINLELKSKFFKDTLLSELKSNNIEPLNKKIVPHYKSAFKINLIINFCDVRKVKELLKNIELTEKENYNNWLNEQRKLYNIN